MRTLHNQQVSMNGREGHTAQIITIIRILKMQFLQRNLPRRRRILQIRNANNIHNRDKETKTKRDDQNNLLFPRQTHLCQDRHGKQQNCQIGNDIHRRRAQIQRDDVGALRIRR